MATRSAIAVMHGERVKAAYCHWDGYLEHNGYILINFYNDSVSANKLVSMGDISGLGATIGEKHEFMKLDLNDEEREALYMDTDSGMSINKECTFYTRDRGEDAPFKSFADLTEFVEYYFDGPGCEFAYVLMDGYWQYCTWKNRCFRPVDEALKKEAA
jgi:hypothetical protein